MKSLIKNNSITLITIFSVLFVIFSWLFTYNSLLNQKDRGTFGDMFGGVNSLFSGLAFCGIIISILIQSSELKLQREEIKNNREELIGSRKAQEEQSIALKRQAENLKISAKLSALNTLVNYYTEKSSSQKKSGYSGFPEKEKAEKYLREIEIILNNKNQ